MKNHSNTINNITLKGNTITFDSRSTTTGNHCKPATHQQCKAMLGLLAQAKNNTITIAKQYKDGRIACTAHTIYTSALTEAYKQHGELKNTHYAWASGIQELNKAVVYYEV